MTQTRIGTVVPVLIVLLSTLSCGRFASSDVAKPTRVVDFPSMAGKSHEEMTELLGQAKPRTLCYGWELAEGELSVCYEDADYAKRLMSSMTYELKPDRGVGSLEEMMALINVNVQGKAKEHRKGFFTYDNIRLIDKSCWVDIHPRSRSFFGLRDPVFKAAELYIRNPKIHLYRTADINERGKTFYEQQTNVNLSVGKVTLGQGDWEVCTEANFTGKCKILRGIDREYLENSNNFSAFGLGETIRSLRPIEDKVR